VLSWLRKELFYLLDWLRFVFMMNSVARPPQSLIVCCDATGKDAIQDPSRTTHVKRFFECLEDYDKDGKIQLMEYFEGVGKVDGKDKWFDMLRGGSMLT
jgi:uncharacterized protein (DUF2235 family)